MLRTTRVILSKPLARLGIGLMFAAIRVLTGLASRFEEGDAPDGLAQMVCDGQFEDAGGSPSPRRFVPESREL